MRCPSCNHDNSADASFCDACGAKLDSICATCGTTNQPGARFCKKCGTRIAPESAPAKPSRPQTGAPNVGAVRVAAEPAEGSALEGERKTVTALFADIKGSTELMEDLDPEAARAIIDPALKLMIEAVRRYDGYVVQSTGDGIFALFGAPVAHEDHPQRALYAALRLQEELERYSAKLRAAGNLPIEGRVGVNTGEVVVRSITTGEGQTEYTPIGHTTNLASRMQALAPTGSIAISEQTRKLVEGYFQLKPLGPTKVKGVTEPVNVYEVTGIGPLRTRLQRAVGRGLTKFVGREREMEAMKHAAGQAQAGHGQIVAAMAEPGVGKSRLFFEFKATSQSGWMVLETFSVSHGKASAYLPVLDLLHSYFKIAGEDDERTRREKVNGKVLSVDRTLEDTLPYLFSLLGIVESEDPLAQMEGQLKKRRTLEAIKRILLRESLDQPLMVIFEDLHWIDEATQEFLNLLADSLGTAKVLLLVNYRPEYSHKWNSKTYYTQLRLDPLAQDSADEMLTALLGPGAEVAPLKRLIIERTEGNPFFMEEMVLVLFDEGALVRNGAVKLTRALNQLRIPPTVQAMLAARIDRLPAEEKDLLQTLAVLGREFPLALIRSVAQKLEDELERMLSELQLVEFIYEQPVAGDVEYIFKHALTQEVAYGSILVERRKTLHERAGRALESLYSATLEERLGELSHHYARSGNTEKAIEYFALAGEQAVQRSAYEEGVILLTKALEALGTLPAPSTYAQRELALQTTLGHALTATKGWSDPGVGAAYARARELCDQIGGPPQRAQVLFGLWAFYVEVPQLQSALELAEDLLSLGQATQDDSLQADAHFALGFALLFLGELVAARDHFEQGIAHEGVQTDRHRASRYGFDPRVPCRAFRGYTLWLLGYPCQALRQCEDALAVAQKLSHPSHPYTSAIAQYVATVASQFCRDCEGARDRAEALIRLSTEQGFTIFLAWGTVLRGWALAKLGEREQGMAEIREGMAICRSHGTELRWPYWLALLAEAQGQSDKTEDILTVLAEALAVADETSERFWAAEIYRLKGEALLRQAMPDTQQAGVCFLQALAMARRQQAKSLELRTTMSLARLLAKQERSEEARTMLAKIYGWFTEGFDTADLKDAKALLEQL